MDRRHAVAFAIIGLVGCGGGDGGGDGIATRVPAASELAGTYDVMVRSDGDAEETPSVGTVTIDTIDDALRLGLSHPSVAVRGSLGADGSIVLVGATTGNDTPIAVEGTAEVAERGGVLRITGTLDRNFAGSRFAFAMERPVGSDARAASGRYRLGFTPSPGPCRCASTIDLDLPIGADGMGTAVADATEIDAAGNVLATLSFAFIDLAPSGRFHLEVAYRDETGGFLCLGDVGGGPCRVRIDGILPAANDEPITSSYAFSTGLGHLLSIGDVVVTRSKAEH